MTLRTLLIVGALAAAFVLSGCAITDPWHEDSRWNEAFGRSYQAQIGEQTADPQAPHSENGPEGLDASTAERVAKRYYRGQDSQKTRKAQAVIIGEL